MSGSNFADSSSLRMGDKDGEWNIACVIVDADAADATEDGGGGWGNETTAAVVNSSFDRQSSVTSAQQPSAVDSVAGEVSNEHQLKAVALYTFESQNADELTVTENEQVTVLLGKSN